MVVLAFAAINALIIGIISLTNVVIVQGRLKKLAAVDEGHDGVRLLLTALQRLQLPRGEHRRGGHGGAEPHPVLLARLEDNEL